MRLITYEHQGQQALGAWIDKDQRIVDLARAAAVAGSPAPAAFQSMQALIDAGPQAWAVARQLVAQPHAGAVHATLECKILAPLPRPIQLRDCLCFPGHVQGVQRVQAERMIQVAEDPDKKRAELKAAGLFEVPAAFYAFPLYYLSNSLSVVGPDADVQWPPYSRFIDYEMEWAAVIGSRCHQVSKEEAGQHIFGYTVFNDWSARDEQMKVMGSFLNLGPGAGKDFANSLGPCIVTADELPNPYELAMKVRVNGQQVSEGSSAGMHFKFEDLISYLSRAHDLHPGEVLGSGTVGGGCSLETGRPVAPGDVVELEVQGIGTLRNRVVAPHMGQSAGAGVTKEMQDAMQRMGKR
jgi:2-keto-4-pentenoate hydratase/2-oxohepta-3-ene-1,7-dioic acid hydratase in catechol pathway